MFFEFWEFIITQPKGKKEEKQEPYVKGEGNFMKEIVYSQKNMDDLFDAINIDEID